jgi:uncharacterized protein
MGMNDDMEKTGSYLFDKTRRGLLTMLYNLPGEAFYVNQIVKDLDSGSGAVQRELRTATEAGLLLREKRGNLVLYRANQEAPIYNELKSIIEKTTSKTIRQDDLVMQRFKINQNVLGEFCRKHYINKLSLYGAVLQPEFGKEDNINVLVEFQTGRAPGFGIADVEKELSELAEHKLEIKSPGELSRYRKAETARQARVVYAVPRAKK